MILTYIFLFLIFIAGVWYYLTFNGFINSRNSVDQAWSNVEVELKRRLDLIDNLVSVVKGYASHESVTLQNVTSLRQHTATAKDANSSEPQIKDQVGKLMAIAEAYPVLKADSQFLNLQRELTNTEDRIAEKRSNYNQAVAMLKNLCAMFPSSFVASLHGFSDRAFFDAPDEVHQTPKVSI